MFILVIMSFIFFLVVVTGMLIGYFAKGKTLQGSCGGINALGLQKICDCPEACTIKRNALAASKKKKRTDY